MVSGLIKQNLTIESRIMNSWFDEVALPVAPACNMMCNFCARDCDCVCNGNSPEHLSKAMTPRQAVHWAAASAAKNRRIKMIKISGPGEPLCNGQTYEVLKRLNTEMPDYVYSISTNGLMLDEKANDLARLHVKYVEVSMNAIFPAVFSKLYARLMKGSHIVFDKHQLGETLLKSQLEGIRQCIEKGISVRVNTIFFPELNAGDVLAIAKKCREMGVRTMRLFSCRPSGKLKLLRPAGIAELAGLQQEVSRIMDEVEIKSFIPLQA